MAGWLVRRSLLREGVLLGTAVCLHWPVCWAVMSNTRFLRRCQTLSSVCFLGLVITTTQSDRQPNLAGTAVPASHGGTTAPPDPAILEGGSPGGGTRNSYGGAGIRDSFPVSTRIVESQRRGDARSGWGAADLAHVELRDPRRAAPSGVDSESGELPLRTQSERVPTHWRDPRELPYGTGPHRPVKRFDDIAEIAESMNDSLFVLFDPPPPTNASENRGESICLPFFTDTSPSGCARILSDRIVCRCRHGGPSRCCADAPRERHGTGIHGDCSRPGGDRVGL